MRTFGHILLGMLLGIILLVVAIGGAVYGLISVPVGDLQNTFNVQLIPQDNPLITQTLLEIIKSAVNDVQNINTLPVRTVLDKYGIKLPDDVKPVLEPLMDVKVGDLINDPNKALDDVVEKVTLNSIVDIANIDKASLTKYPIMAENMDKNVATAMKSFTDLLDANTLTIRGLKDNLGFTLGEMELLDEVQDLPIPNFADAIQTIEIGTVLGVDTDKFIPNNNIQVFAKVDRFELVTAEENPNAVKYLAEIKDGKQVKKELHFVLKDKPATEAQTTTDTAISQNKDDYKVDNGESTPENPKTFYRFVEYEPYVAETHINNDLYVGTIINSFVASGTTYIPKDSVKLSAKNLFIEDTVTLEAQIKNATIAVIDGKIAKLEDVKYSVYDEATKVTSYVQAPHYGFVAPATSETVLSENIDGFLRVYAGTSDMAIQHLSGLTINELSQNPTDKIMTLKLSDVLKDIKEDNPLYSLKDCMLKDIPDEIKTLKVGDVITNIRNGVYTENPDGDYVYLTDEKYYTFYSKDKHPGLTRYDYHGDYSAATATEITSTAPTKYIWTGAEFKPQTQTEVDTAPEQQYYVKVTASSRLLQRMATTDLNGITSLIETVVLGDIMEIDSTNMLYALAGCTIKEIPEKIDTLTINEVLKTIKVGAYTPNPNGAYVFDGSSYTVYNPITHKEIIDRFDYHNDYYIASKAEIKNDKLPKFVWNVNKFDSVEQTYVDANPDNQYFIHEAASSKILQNLANTQLNGLDGLLNKLVLGDVIDLDLDTYVLYDSASPQEGDFYYFKDDMYKRAFQQEDKSFVDKKGTKLDGVAIYQISKKGESHTIIKKLANIKINNMGNAFTTLMEELYFTDLIEVSQNAVVKENSKATKKAYIVEEYELTPGLTYVLDNEGMYYQSGVKYLPVETDIRKIPATAKQYKVVRIKDTIDIPNPTDIANLITNSLAKQNIYIENTTGFTHNLPYAAYLVTKGRINSLYTRVDSAAPVYNGGPVTTPVAYPVTAKSSATSPVKLFVLVNGGYVEYDPTNLAHCDLQLFYRLSKGFYPTAEPTEFFYRPSDGKFYTSEPSSEIEGVTSGGIYQEGDVYFTQLDAVDGADKYYYNNINDYTALISIPGSGGATLEDIDAAYKFNEADNRFAQQRVFSIKLENSVDDITGYLTTDLSEVQKGGFTLSTAKKDATKTLISYEIIKEKSASLLCSLAASRNSITELDAILKMLELGDILDIAPGSLFEHLEHETLGTLSTAIPGLFSSLTIGELISYLNITTIDPGVLSLIGNLTFPKFFSSLTIDATTGAITFDMEKLFK